MKRNRVYRKRTHAVQRFLLWLLAVVVLVPVIVTILFSFFSPAEIKTMMGERGSLDTEKWMNLHLAPQMFSLSQYENILITDTSVLQMFVMSVFYTVMILLGQAIFIPMMAYALSRFKFRGRRIIFAGILLLMLLP